MLGTASGEEVTVVVGGSSAGGVGAFNIASWILDSFDKVSWTSGSVAVAPLFNTSGVILLLVERLKLVNQPHISEWLGNFGNEFTPH